MKSIKIKLLAKSDTESLFSFEEENRVYFDSIGLSRNSAYYERDTFEQIVSELIDEQNRGIHYMYLVIDGQERIVGRVNFTEVARGPLNKAELGYRIGEQYQRKGFATAAVHMALNKTRTVHHFHRIEAGTSPENRASQIVLIKNGFQFVGRYHQHFLLGEKWIDSLLFEKIIDN